MPSGFLPSLVASGPSLVVPGQWPVSLSMADPALILYRFHRDHGPLLRYPTVRAHDPERWTPVFPKRSCSTKRSRNNHEPPNQKTPGETRLGRSPEGRAAVSRLTGRAAAAASSRRQAAAAVSSAPRGE